MPQAYDDPRVKPHARAAAAEIRDKFGIVNIGGFATSGHIPGSDHYTGHAIDVMTTVHGQTVSNYAQNNATRWGVKYIIWNRGYWEPGKNWTKYTGTNPHTSHVHISFTTQGGSGGDPVDNITGAPQGQQRNGCAQLLIDLFGLG